MKKLAWFGLCVAGLYSLSVGSAPAQDAAEKPYGLTERIPWTTSRVVGRPEPPPPYQAVRIYPNLVLKEPVFIAQEPGSHRLLVGQREGKIYAFSKDDAEAAFSDDPQAAAHVPELFLDTERELYAFSFHPNYEKNGQIFVFSPTDLSEKREGQLSRVSRFTATLEHPRRVDPATEEIIVEWPAGGHNGGEAIIGPDGYLYVCTGDGTSDSDGNESGQGVDDLNAVMMRIDVEHPEPGKPYSVPKDNPFVDYPGARPEIWAFGFRNPWRMSFDAHTGLLWVGDVGQDLWEMVRVVQRGGNYGWSVQEGTHPFRLDRKRGPGPILPPVVEHHHTECRSITGGYVYYGEKFPELNGVYFYGDYEYGKVWGLRYDGQKVTWHEELADTPLRPPGFTVTRGGDILILDHLAGEIYSLERSPAADDGSKFPRKLSETGIFSSVENQEPAPGVIPYSVNTPVWHDGAVAERFLAMPGTSQIEFIEKSTDANTWTFEDGTVTVQTLSLESEPGNPSSRRRIETRIVVKQQNHWLGYTYLWNDEQTDATLVDAAGTDLMLAVADPADGKTVQQPWHVPSRTECMVCHSRAAGFVLGLNTLQMNRDHDYGGVVDNQLRAFDHVGIFKKPLAKAADEYDALPGSYNKADDLNARARAYLYVNCSVCHVVAGGGNAQMELRYETEPDKTKLFDVEPLHDSFGLAGAHLVTSGDPYASVLFYRMATLGRGRMPRVASNVPDDDALDLIYRWILSLEPSGAEKGGAQSRPQQAEAAARQSLRDALELSPSQREQALANLLADTRSALVVYRLITTDRVPPELRKPLIAAATAHPDVNVRDLFERFVPPSKRRKRLGTNVNTEELLALAGDAERGRQAFLSGVASQCKTCHTINGIGGNVGPNLSGIGKKYTRAQLLEAILEPSKQIEPKYTAFLLTTTAGKVYTGLLEQRTDEGLELRDANGELIRVPAGEVEQLEPQKQSLMPELALRDFTAQEAADLLEFLTTLKQPVPDSDGSPRK